MSGELHTIESALDAAISLSQRVMMVVEGLLGPEAYADDPVPPAPSGRLSMAAERASRATAKIAWAHESLSALERATTDTVLDGNVQSTTLRGR